MGNFEEIHFAYISGTREVMPDDSWGIYTRGFDRNSSDDVSALGRSAGVIVETTLQSASDDEFVEAVVRFGEAAEPPINDPTFTVAALGVRASRRNAADRDAQRAQDSLLPRVDYLAPARVIDPRGVTA